MRISLKKTLLGFVVSALALASTAQAGPATRVNAMPDRQVRPTNAALPAGSIPVFGSANGGVGTANGETYTWTFSVNPDVLVNTDGSLNGTVTNDRYIFENVSFKLLNGSTREIITATLQVSGAAGPSATVKIDIVDPTNPISDTPLENLQIDVNISIANGLRGIYLTQNTSNGSWPGLSGQVTTCGTTAFNVWAMSNSGHRATNSYLTDIYAEWVQRAAYYILNQSRYAPSPGNQRSLSATNAMDVSPDLNGNGRIINLCPMPGQTDGNVNSLFGGGHPESPGYASPVATAALIASFSADTTVLVPASVKAAYSTSTIKTIIEDAVEWSALAQYENPTTFPGDQNHGGWLYAVNQGGDTSVDSWHYVAVEGYEAVLKGANVPDALKTSAENRIHWSQNPNAGANYGQFGYRDRNPIGSTSGNATTAGGLSGLVMVSQKLDLMGNVIPRTGVLLDGAGTYAASFGGVAQRKAAAVGILGQNWNVVGDTWQGNKPNFYAMWTTARALRLNGSTQLVNGGVTFDWQTGEETTAPGVVPGSASPREGFFPFLVRTQASNGLWNATVNIHNWSQQLNTAWGILILQPKVFPAPCEDSDNDSICDVDDNCVTDGNGDQNDADGDGQGDACDVCPTNAANDADGDGVCEDVDNCDTDPNADQVDADGDTIGDACDACPNDAANDADGDGICGDVDNCATANSDQLDTDADGTGDACDTCPLDAANDADADGVCGDVDNCALAPNGNQADADGDGTGDVCDACVNDPANDADGDGLCADVDNCDTSANPGQQDGDGDGQGDACDACPNDAANDADGDGFCADVDNCDVNANPNQADTDGDGLGDACDTCALDPQNDADGDGFCANVDNCDVNANPNQADTDGDGTGDACDACVNDPLNDIDGDGVCGDVDNCPTTANANQTDTDGNGVGDACTTSQNASGGAFVVGNLANLSGNAIVNFWGSQWTQANPMSGGAGPNAFKGFASSVAVPACGSAWTTSPGNSSNPPAAIPAFMTVIISSNVTKTGSTISGNVQKVLIVETQPGYGNSPGHQGYGRVVAVVCSQ